MPYRLYVRKSRSDAEAESRSEGETLSRHINTFLEFSKRRRMEIISCDRLLELIEKG